jgi:hypothetical protein
VVRTEKSQEMKAMYLTLNEHRRKLRAPIRDISYWLVNADFSDFVASLSCLCLEDSSTLRTSTITAASHDYLLPPTTTCSLPRLPAAFHEYLLPTTTKISVKHSDFHGPPAMNAFA